ncbi:hypothetical protein [Streptomyces sp. enrichment culture]|uniref:hypothetical protein n=1 Tax=Streptomyces sp. enrichment culture TaxID=1795815 RepID=UPI003F559176
MHTHADGPLPLPSAFVPEGCPVWDAEGGRRWTAALAPRWVPGRGPEAAALGLTAAVLVASGALHLYADLPAWAAALAALHLVWLTVRPEIVPLSAPVTAAVVLSRQDAPIAVRVVVAVLLVAACALVVPRLLARRRQRAVALAVAGGATGVAPGPAGVPAPQAGVRVTRGRFLIGAGVVLAFAGTALFTVRDAWELSEDRAVTPALAWAVVGLGATMLLSGFLARLRAKALRAGPVPVLRVLVREAADMDLEVFAADDRAARRPLFRVGTSVLYEEEPHPEEGPDDDEDDGDDGDDSVDEEWQALLDRLDADEPGPLREAVLYGTPYDGAEVIVAGADERPGAPPVTEYSTGPVRPLSEHAARRRAERRQRAAADEAADQQRVDALAASLPGGRIRRWRAGARDWLSALGALALACFFVWGETGLFRWLPGVFVAVLVATCLPHMTAWHITADREGLWLDGLKGPRHIAWEHLRLIRVDKHELKIDSTRRDFDEWTLFGNRWRRLERRFGLVHRQDRIAAELTAMWKDPAKRPADPAGPRLRGGPLWPYGLAAAVAWTALLLFVLP